ncbi:hypothetical protein Tco_0000877 [Tanacetum coccineum]
MTSLSSLEEKKSRTMEAFNIQELGGRQSWKKGRLPLSAENAGTSAAEDIDLDEDNGKYMMTGKEECEEENVYIKRDCARSEPTEVANVKQLQSTLEEEEEHVND